MNEKLLDVDRRRTLPEWTRQTFTQRFRPAGGDGPSVVLFNDTFMNYFEPEIGEAAVDVLRAAGTKVELVGHRCCGRPLISKGLLESAREHAAGILREILRRSGDELTRENIMKQALNLKGFRTAIMLPGVQLNTQPNQHELYEKLWLQRFDGDTWKPFGEPLAV